MNRKIIISLALSLAFPTLLHAQDTPIVAVAVNEFSIQQTANGKFKLYDPTSQKVIIDGADSIIRKQYFPYYIVKNNKRGVLNYLGHPYIPIEYGKLESLSPFFLLAEKNGKKGIIKKGGTTILDTIYDEIKDEGFSWSDQGRFHVRKGDKWGICNGDGKYLADLKYDEMHDLTPHPCLLRLLPDFRR